MFFWGTKFWAVDKVPQILSLPGGSPVLHISVNWLSYSHFDIWVGW